MLPFKTDVLQLASIKRALTESSTGDLVFRSHLVPQGITLTELSGYSILTKADKLTDGTTGNLLILSSNGNYADSGYSPSTITNLQTIYDQQQDEITNLQDQITAALGSYDVLYTTNNVSVETLVEEVSGKYYAEWSVFVHSVPNTNKLYFSKIRALTNKTTNVYYTEYTVLGNYDVDLNVGLSAGKLQLKATPDELSNVFVIRHNSSMLFA